MVIDGGGKVTLNGGDETRILYMNTCDPAQRFTTEHGDNQETPRLTVQNLTFEHANSQDEKEYDGGGAIWAGGGQLEVINSRCFNNVCATSGPGVGGGAIRAFSQLENRPVYVVGSTFGGARGYSNVGAISSIEVSWSIINRLFSHNYAPMSAASTTNGTPSEARMSRRRGEPEPSRSARRGR